MPQNVSEFVIQNATFVPILAKACKNCSEGTITVGLGSKSHLECGCKEGQIETARDSLGIPECQTCQTGLSCPKFSTINSLMSGTSELGDDFVPQLEPGYMTLEAEPLSVT